MSQPPLLAGAVPELPVVGYSVILALKTDEGDVYSYEYLTLNLTHKGPEPLTLHAPAQATIHAQAAEIERLKRERDELSLTVARRRSDLDDANKCIRELAGERNALRAKQVAEADEVMRLADEYARSMWSRTSTSKQTDAAREALRAFLTKDRT